MVGCSSRVVESRSCNSGVWWMMIFLVDDNFGSGVLYSWWCVRVCVRERCRSVFCCVQFWSLRSTHGQHACCYCIDCTSNSHGKTPHFFRCCFFSLVHFFFLSFFTHTHEQHCNTPHCFILTVLHVSHTSSQYIKKQLRYFAPCSGVGETQTTTTAQPHHISTWPLCQYTLGNSTGLATAPNESRRLGPAMCTSFPLSAPWSTPCALTTTISSPPCWAAPPPRPVVEK